MAWLNMSNTLEAPNVAYYLKAGKTIPTLKTPEAPWCRFNWIWQFCYVQGFAETLQHLSVEKKDGPAAAVLESFLDFVGDKIIFEVHNLRSPTYGYQPDEQVNTPYDLPSYSELITFSKLYHGCKTYRPIISTSNTYLSNSLLSSTTIFWETLIPVYPNSMPCVST